MQCSIVLQCRSRPVTFEVALSFEISFTNSVDNFISFSPSILDLYLTYFMICFLISSLSLVTLTNWGNVWLFLFCTTYYVHMTYMIIWAGWPVTSEYSLLFSICPTALIKLTSCDQVNVMFEVFILYVMEQSRQVVTMFLQYWPF